MTTERSYPERVQKFRAGVRAFENNSFIRFITVYETVENMTLLTGAATVMEDRDELVISFPEVRQERRAPILALPSLGGQSFDLFKFEIQNQLKLAETPETPLFRGSYLALLGLWVDVSVDTSNRVIEMHRKLSSAQTIQEAMEEVVEACRRPTQQS